VTKVPKVTKAEKQNIIFILMHKTNIPHTLSTLGTPGTPGTLGTLGTLVTLGTLNYKTETTLI
jgi:hypothetical protein